jgi:hypothetical protein
MRARRLQLRGCLVVLVLSTAIPGLAQDATQPAEPPATPIADEAERVARALWADGLEHVQSDGSTFRLNIRAPQVEMRAPWLDDPQPNRRRPVGGSIYHQQMLEHITPQAFRASTLNSAAVGVDPALIVNGVRDAWRSWQVRRIRAQIARELEELDAANAAANR